MDTSSSGGHTDSSGAPSPGTAGNIVTSNELDQHLLPASNGPSSSQNASSEAQAKFPTKEKFKQLQIDTGNKPEESSQATLAGAADDRSVVNPQAATLTIAADSQPAGPDITNSDGKQIERLDGIDRPTVPEDAHAPLADPNLGNPEQGQSGGNNEKAADFTTILTAEDKRESDSSSWDNEYDARMTLRYLKPNQVLRAPVATQNSRFHTRHFADVTLVTGPARIHCYTTSADGVYPPYCCGLPSTYAGEQPAVPGPWTDLIERELVRNIGDSESKSSYPPADSKEDKPPFHQNEVVTTSKADESESADSTFPVGSLVDHTVPIKWKRKSSRAMHVERFTPPHLASSIQHIPVDMHPEMASHQGQAKSSGIIAVKTGGSADSSSKDVRSDDKDDEEGWLRSESKGGDSGDDEDDFTRRGFYAGIDRRKYWARYGYRDGHGGARIEEKEPVVEAESKSRDDSSEGSVSRRRYDNSK